MGDTEVIARLARKVESLESENENLKDTVRRHRECTEKRKRQAGVSNHVSIDEVWDEALNALKEKKAGTLGEKLDNKLK